MKIISKFLVWLLSALLLFIIINLWIGLVKYKSLSNYSIFLNQKDWSTVISQINIKNPSTIFHIFYWETINIPKQILSWEVEKDIEIQEESPSNDNNINPYDPEFQDEFNNFFGTTQTWQQNNIKDNNEPGFISDLSVSNTDADTEKTVGQ